MTVNISFNSKLSRPPRPTIFPYTTLFRSVHVCPGDHESILEDDNVGQVARELKRVLEEISDVPGDRKSTRLNSSHRCISYDVFCLKKKIITINILNGLQLKN